MRVCLTYTGPLIGKQKDPPKDRPDKTAAHVHSIRRVFHRQLKTHWAENSFLSEATSYPSDHRTKQAHIDGIARIASSNERQLLTEFVPDFHRMQNYRFLPLVREAWDLQCELDILFLRKNPPGSLIQAGDIDNRIKTLLDALRMAINPQELAGNESPHSDENPFFVLLEDDQLVSKLNVDTDRLLNFDGADEVEDRWVQLVIMAKLVPVKTTMFNLSMI